MASSPGLVPAPQPPREEVPSPVPAAKATGLRHKSRRLGKRRWIPLPLKLRIGLFLIGWTLVLVGVAGLVLPGIQGILTILVGASVLSLVSELVYELMHWLLARWPKIWRRFEAFRLKMHRRLRRFR